MNSKQIHDPGTESKPNVNDIHYPQWAIDHLENNGVDTSNFIKIRDDQLRGALTSDYATEWFETDDDGNIVLPFVFGPDYPAEWQDNTIAWMERIGRDFGCIKTVYDPAAALLERKWEHGIVFMPDNSCWSALGLAPGYTGDVINDIEDIGVPPGWQVIGMAEDCGGNTVQG